MAGVQLQERKLSMPNQKPEHQCLVVAIADNIVSIVFQGWQKEITITLSEEAARDLKEDLSLLLDTDYDDSDHLDATFKH